MTASLFVIQIVLAIFITIIVLLQKSSSIGLGAYSGSNESVFGAKGPAGFLAKFTMFLGLLFILNTVALAYFYNQENQKSVLDSLPTDILQAPSAPESASQESQENSNAFVVDENLAPSAPTLFSTLQEQNK